MRYVFLAALALCSAAHLYYSWVDNKRGRAATKPFLLILLVLYYVFSADRLSFVLLGALVTSWLGDVLLIPRGHGWFAAGGISIGTVTMEYTTIITIVISAVVMIVLYEFTQKTRLGRAMRCVSEDKAAATLMGINVNHTILLTFAIGSGLAAIAALMYMAQYPKVYTTMGSLLGLKAFVSAVLGGIGIIPGAVLGGIVIGLIESFTTSYISSSMADTFVFLILIIVLIIKPAGILGRNAGEKV